MLATAIDRALRFLLESQEAEGQWRDFEVDGGFESDAWVTAYVGCAVAACPVVERSVVSALSAARRFLICSLGDRGGWGYCAAAPVDADSTAWAIEMLRSVQAPLKPAYEGLRRHRYRDGGFATYERFSDPSMWTTSQSEVSAVALKAMLSEGLTADRATIDACASFLIESQTGDGTWPSFWYSTRHYATVHAFEALARYNTVASLRCGPLRAFAWALRTYIQGDPFTLALTTELGCLCGDWRAVDLLVAELLSLQHNDGRWTAREPFMLPDPWNYEAGDPDAGIFDHNGLFTTATVIRALSGAVALPRS